jgi:peroxin-3
MTDDDGRSMVSLQSESGVHASQIAVPSLSPVPGSDAGAEEGSHDQGKPKARKTKRQLWDDLTISCE